jgi:5'(3')-deoxyribonucleotidase
MSEKKKLYVDFDGVIVNTVANIVTMYNEDFKYYKKFKPVKWWEVNTWDFVECECATKEYINTYFNQSRFFDRLTYMDWAKETLDELKNDYEIIIVSSGYSPNLRAKEMWIKGHLPYCKFIGVNLKEYKDKSHIDMSDGSVFIDDSMSNLITSNALINICFGDVYSWNEKWEGFRCKNWIDVKEFLAMKRGGNNN